MKVTTALTAVLVSHAAAGEIMKGSRHQMDALQKRVSLNVCMQVGPYFLYCVDSDCCGDPTLGYYCIPTGTSCCFTNFAFCPSGTDCQRIGGVPVCLGPAGAKESPSSAPPASSSPGTTTVASTVMLPSTLAASGPATEAASGPATKATSGPATGAAAGPATGAASGATATGPASASAAGNGTNAPGATSTQKSGAELVKGHVDVFRPLFYLAVLVSLPLLLLC